jgi:hypothetical protein
MFRRRRPLARAAVVGGTAYYAGKRAQRHGDERDEMQAQIEDLQYQQAAQAQAMQSQPAAAPAGGISDDAIQQLQKLSQLKDAGVLTEEEFNAQKMKILNG